MAVSERSCILEPKRGSGLFRINLPHGIPVQIGRSPLSGLKDIECSRRQLILVADCENGLVSVKQEGTNPSGVNGFSLKRNEEIVIGDLTHVELLLNKYTYVVTFKPPIKKVQQTNGKDDENKLKRKMNSSQDENTPKKVKIIEKDTKNTTNFRNSPQKYTKIDNEVISKTCEENVLEKLENGLLYVLTTKNVTSSSKIAAYDLDKTLIKTKSGRVFPKDIDDWQLCYNEVPGKLKQIHESGFKITVFTNQSQISKGKLKAEDFQRKIENIFRKIGVPVQAYISASKGKYRKPHTGMWDTLCRKKNDGIPVDMDVSFYCGDAAGRKGDHSFVDRFFAENLVLSFYTPEQHFKGGPKPHYEEPSFNPKLIDRDAKNQDLICDKQEVIVMTGFPGCGKSSLSKKIEITTKGRYKILCRDTLKTWQKCVSDGEKFLKCGRSIIADSTNLDIESRSRWTNLAKKYKIPCRCVWFDMSINHCKHNNIFRELTDKSHATVTEMVFNNLKGKLQEPDISEGFLNVVKIKFVPEFESKDLETLYFKHLLEK